MARMNSCLRTGLFCLSSMALAVPLIVISQQAQAITSSIGQPYHGKLVNGVQFPTQFSGYYLRDPERSYTTPEVVGALLDAVEAVRTKFPNTCDLFIGDFSIPSGGSAAHHRSHQNGRDVDLGMYARDNRPLTTFASMGEDNLDPAKTWCLIENLIRSQRVQYIFLDRGVQRIIYNHALAQGVDPGYLERVFGNTKGSIVQHVRNHVDHIHVRFFSPWSTLAGHVGSSDEQKRMVIEMAQQAYMPKKVNYYVNGSERGLDSLATSFGVTRRDLTRWNQLSGSSVLTPGNCLVFYKRGFEADSVNLAQCLQPGSIPEAPPVHIASLRSSAAGSSDSASDAPSQSRYVRPARHEPVQSGPSLSSYSIVKGDTLYSIAKRSGMDVKSILQLNGMRNSSGIKPGRTIKLTAVMSTPTVDDAPRSYGAQHKAGASDQKHAASAPMTYTVARGETIQSISKKTGIDQETLKRTNGMRAGTKLRPGATIILAKADLEPVSQKIASAERATGHGSSKSDRDKASTAVKQPEPKQPAASRDQKSARGSSAKVEKVSAKADKNPVKTDKSSSKAEKSSAKIDKMPVKAEKTSVKNDKSPATGEKISVKGEKGLAKNEKNSEKLAVASKASPAITKPQAPAPKITGTAAKPKTAAKPAEKPNPQTKSKKTT